jgi:protein involved in polysaccharide export with SLBB domain
MKLTVPLRRSFFFHGRSFAVFLTALLGCCVAANSPSVMAQAADQRRAPMPSSELGRENLSRVAASAGEIKAVLFKDAGLMVALKYWVAKDATEHGQIISESDLTNDAIFERLEEDAQFRSVATALVQRYGYLLPKLNPESDVAREHELLVQERTKWLAQNQEEELANARRRRERDLQNAKSCDPKLDVDCTARHSEFPTESAQPSPQSGVPVNPGEESRPANPPARDSYGSPQTTQTDYQQTPQAESESSEISSPLDDSPRSRQSSDSFVFDGTPRELSVGQTNRRNQSVPEPFDSSEENRNAIEESTTYQPNGSSTYRPEGSTRSQPRSNGLNGMAPEELSVAKPPNAREVLGRPADLVRTANPYNDIPSLYDMYMQALPQPVTPQRFGMQVFAHGARDSKLIPMDLPVGPDYVVGPGDGLSINLWGGVSQRLYRTVDHEGRVSLPEVGPILVSGKSLAEVQENLQQILRTQFRDVSADVSLGRLRTIRIYDVGDVKNAGAYDVSSLSTPLNALFAAGGPTAGGSLRILKHYRGDQLVQIVDVYDLLLRGVKTDILRLESGDTVLVPPIGAQITVEGMVRRPAIYELRDEKNLASVLELAGGLLPTAALRHIEVQRILAHEKQTMLSVDIPETDQASEVTKQLVAFEIHDGDRIRIYPIAPYNQDAVYLEGHVIRPGRYSYRADMRVTDVISSYKDLLPEPSNQYAEIIRLNAPDFHPSVESFDLSSALENPSQAPLLQTMDTIRIFSRFDFENPPAVSIWGDVRQPGTYRTSGQVRLSDAVHLAGGLAPDAQTEDAQVFRYLPDGKVRIFSVNLEQALAGDSSENILMQPRDRLLVHRNPDAVEPATVNVQGEVAKPGRYPLTTNMQVGDLIRVGGGLTPSAETQTADLTHYQWVGNGQAANGAANPTSAPNQLTAKHETIAITAALAGDPKADVALHNGDVLTIGQLPGWNDLGASIRVKGEVANPGTYGIRPGERLSSIIERAGGFQSDAYPYGAVLQRTQVRELEAKGQNEMILRVQDAQTTLQLLPDADPKAKQAKEMALQQWQTSLELLNSNPPLGRVTIRISSNVDHWKDTNADINVRAGDTLLIPKRPSFVMVTGQVFNPTAVSFRPGKSAKWYLSQSGGPTQLANKKAIFVIRADGSVIGSSSSAWAGDSMSRVLEPGDTLVVPERALGGGVQWQSVFLAAQTAASVASAIIIAVRF